MVISYLALVNNNVNKSSAHVRTLLHISLSMISDSPFNLLNWDRLNDMAEGFALCSEERRRHSAFWLGWQNLHCHLEIGDDTLLLLGRICSFRDQIFREQVGIRIGI